MLGKRSHLKKQRSEISLASNFSIFYSFFLTNEFHIVQQIQEINFHLENFFSFVNRRVFEETYLSQFKVDNPLKSEDVFYLLPHDLNQVLVQTEFYSRKVFSIYFISDIVFY